MVVAALGMLPVRRGARACVGARGNPAQQRQRRGPPGGWGLVRWSCMPTSRLRWRSPSMAWAVMAMMGEVVEPGFLADGSGRRSGHPFRAFGCPSAPGRSGGAGPFRDFRHGIMAVHGGLTCTPVSSRKARATVRLSSTSIDQQHPGTGDGAENRSGWPGPLGWGWLGLVGWRLG